MKRLSLTEFESFCKEQGVKSFIYNTNNQNWYDKFKEFALMDFNFKEAGISLNPNILYFKNGSSVMRLNCVKCIYVTEETETESKVFSVVCGIDTDKKIVFIGSR